MAKKHRKRITSINGATPRQQPVKKLERIRVDKLHRMIYCYLYKHFEKDEEGLYMIKGKYYQKYENVPHFWEIKQRVFKIFGKRNEWYW